MRIWVKTAPAKAETATCLFDYELAGFKETGLSLAEELGPGARIILVTSRHEEPYVNREAARLKICIIPKGLVSLIPILIKAAAPAAGAAVLLDDDPLVHMNWKLAAKAAGVELKACKTPADLNAAIENLPRDTPVYIDSDLGNGIKGELIAGELHNNGYSNISMATGHSPEKFAHLPWLKVTGKEPPGPDSQPPTQNTGNRVKIAFIFI